ncbi:hypothetical protein K492DRAFT_238860 [Lichtheimia hyalospora FSU 10163]|nr:hypothetical protein K492DRAFT_238860 [Lichtheimia hyalospora FSU 10163]
MDDDNTTVLPIQFQLLYNYDISSEYDSLRKRKTHMHPALACELNGIRIYRLIDYNLEQHYVSAGQLWRACGLTVTEGLFLFDLRISDYEVDFLIPHFPFCDVWVTVSKARHMASILNVETELELLCLVDHDPIFSSDNITRGELVHNWKVEAIPNALYSTRALLETPVNMPIESLTGQRKIRTQISRNRQPGMVCKDRLETGLVRLAIAAYEAFVSSSYQHHEEPQSTSEDQSSNSGITTQADALWDVFQGLLFDFQNLTLQKQQDTRVYQDSMMIGNMPLRREYLRQGNALQRVYVAGMTEKLFAELQRRPCPPSPSQQPLPPQPSTPAAHITSPHTSTPTPAEEKHYQQHPTTTTSSNSLLTSSGHFGNMENKK